MCKKKGRKCRMEKEEERLEKNVIIGGKTEERLRRNEDQQQPHCWLRTWRLFFFWCLSFDRLLLITPPNMTPRAAKINLYLCHRGDFSKTRWIISRSAEEGGSQAELFEGARNMYDMMSEETSPSGLTGKSHAKQLPKSRSSHQTK